MITDYAGQLNHNTTRTVWQILCVKGVGVQRRSYKKKIIQMGFYDNGTGQHQSNTVYSGKGMIPALTTITGGGTEQIKVLKRLDRVTETATILASKQASKQVVVVGGIGKNDRKNRDGFRVLSGKGIMYALQSHISQEPPLVLRKWTR